MYTAKQRKQKIGNMYNCIYAHFFFSFNFFIVLLFAFTCHLRRLEEVVTIGHLYTGQPRKHSHGATLKPEWEHLKAHVEAEIRRWVSCHFILGDDN